MTNLQTLVRFSIYMKKSVSRFAEAAGVQNIVIDGNDVCLVADTMQKARKEMLNSNKPFFLECITYR